MKKTDPKLALTKAMNNANGISNPEQKAKLSKIQQTLSRSIKGNKCTFSLTSIKVNCPSFVQTSLHCDLPDLYKYLQVCLPSFENRIDSNPGFSALIGSWARNVLQVEGRNADDEGTVGASILAAISTLVEQNWQLKEALTTCLNYTKQLKGQIRIAYDTREKILGTNACKKLDVFENTLSMLGSSKMSLKGYTDLAIIYNSIAHFMFTNFITDNCSTKETGLSLISRNLVRSIPPVSNEPEYLAKLQELGVTKLELDQSRMYRATFFRSHKMLMNGASFGTDGFWIANVVTNSHNQRKQFKK